MIKNKPGLIPEKNKRRSKKPYRKYSGKAKIPKIKPGADGTLKKVFAKIGAPEKSEFKPDPFQIKALAAMEESDCLVTAPTGAGKTWIAEQAISKLHKQGKRAWYASPLKALTNSKYVEFQEIFGPQNIGILTGDRKENHDAPIIIGTTEILRNQLYDAMHKGETLDSDLIILDEAHFLGDEDRGVVWEEIMIYLPVRIPLLLLSATIGNANEIAEWLTIIRSKDCRVIKAKKRPVPLYPLFMHPEGTIFPLMDPAIKKTRLFKKVQKYIDNPKAPIFSRPYKLPHFGGILRVLRKYNLLPAIFFLKSRLDCDNAIFKCKKNRIEDQKRKELLARRVNKLVAQNPHIANHKQLRFLKINAVGAHHSGQLPAWKIILETLMTQGLLDAVFATSTVAAGVNFPARTIVFLNSDRFNGKEFLPMTPTEYHQMTGRAGRRGMDNIGFAVAIPGKFMDVPLVAKLQTKRPSRVKSQIKINFSMTLNLLLSHTPDQIEDLLKQSFATYQLIVKREKEKVSVRVKNLHKYLWRDYMRHHMFLQETGYVDSKDRLTEDGVWASQLRVDQPLLIASGFRLEIFPESDPALLAAVVAVFVNEKEADSKVNKDYLPKKLVRAIFEVEDSLKPFLELYKLRGFQAPSFFIRPAAAIFAWASGKSWNTALEIAETAEGDLAMLILRTADNLRHIKGLRAVFPKVADTAGEAIDLLLRTPVVMDYED